MEAYVYWFMLAAVLLGVEMTTSTFYFLVLSVAAAMGGVLALAGLGGAAIQFSLAGLFAVAGTMWLRHEKKTHRPARDIGLDIGQTVKVVAWNADGTARVSYRGAEWDAEPESPDTARDATLYIKLMQGSKLILTQHKPK